MQTRAVRLRHSDALPSSGQARRVVTSSGTNLKRIIAQLRLNQRNQPGVVVHGARDLFKDTALKRGIAGHHRTGPGRRRAHLPSMPTSTMSHQPRHVRLRVQKSRNERLGCPLFGASQARADDVCVAKRPSTRARESLTETMNAEFTGTGAVRPTAPGPSVSTCNSVSA